MSQIGDRIKGLPLKREIAECPEWSESTGKTFYIRELSGDERLDYERKQIEGGLNAEGEMDKRAFIASTNGILQEVVVQSLVDEHDERVFDDLSDLEDVSGEIVTRLAAQAVKISKLMPDKVEAEIKNSDGDQTAATG